jgi:hypothetical protein
VLWGRIGVGEMVSKGTYEASRSDPRALVQNSSHDEGLEVDRVTSVSPARGGNPHGSEGVVCGACLSVGWWGFCFSYAGQRSTFSSHRFHRSTGLCLVVRVWFTRLVKPVVSGKTR